MGLIELSETVPDAKKFVISLWFRVPQESIDAAKAEFNADPQSSKDMTGVIPLAVFGPPTVLFKGQSASFDPNRVVGVIPAVEFWSWKLFPAGHCDLEHWEKDTTGLPSSPYTVSDSTFAEEILRPSYIGVDCSGDFPALSVNLVMPSGSKAKFTMANPKVASVDYSVSVTGRQYGGSSVNCPDIGPVVGVYPVADYPLGNAIICFEFNPSTAPTDTEFSATTTYEDNSEKLFGARQEAFRTLPANDGVLSNGIPPGFIIPSELRIIPGHWHHLLLSVDLTELCETRGTIISSHTTHHAGSGAFTSSESGESATYETVGSRTTSACKMCIALDDKNLTGKAMSVYWPNGHSDENAIISVNGMCVATTTLRNTTSVNDDCFGNRATGIDTHGDDPPKYSYSPGNVPFSAGVFGLPSTSTYVGDIRRVEMAELQIFTDVSINTGIEANRRAFITDKGKPASMGLAKELLGKLPEVKMHGSNNWKKSRNTGSLSSIPRTDGTAIGDIETYKPNPNLNGGQGN